MPRRAKTERAWRITDQNIEALRAAIVAGWPWRLREDDKFHSIPLDDKLQILLSHLTGVFTISCGFPNEPHPSDETITLVRSELATELREGEKKWGHLVPRKDRWHSDDLRRTTPSWEPRETY